MPCRAAGLHSFQPLHFHADNSKMNCLAFLFPRAAWFFFISCCGFSLNFCRTMVLKVWPPGPAGRQQAPPGNLLEIECFRLYLWNETPPPWAGAVICVYTSPPRDSDAWRLENHSCTMQLDLLNMHMLAQAWAPRAG